MEPEEFDPIYKQAKIDCENNMKQTEKEEEQKL